ncbi:MaoC family dehydratase [Antarctobacter sp.]|uniref:MaoC family dehydratase n=1 Tax=Antarctobacter sp. TaxID=1872577 RepID=UPI003A8D6D4F
MPANYQERVSGKYYEELEVGAIYKASITRTVTEMDNTLFSSLTHNMAWLHLDAEYSKDQMFGQRLMNSNFTLSLAASVQVIDLTLGTTVANMGYDQVKFPNPVFAGDTLYVESEVMSKRESKSRQNVGLVEFETRGYNQRDELVVIFRRTSMMIKKSSLETVG